MSELWALLVAGLPGMLLAEGLVLWSPTLTDVMSGADVCARVRFDLPALSPETLPPPPQGVRGALARVQKDETTCAYCGWTSDGWQELVGLEAGPEPVEARMVICEDRVSYYVSGVQLVSSQTGLSALPTVCGEAVSTVSDVGDGRIQASRIGGIAFDATNALAAADWRVSVPDDAPKGMYPLVSSNAEALRPKITVEGPRKSLCALDSDGRDGLVLSVSDLPYDEGGYVLAFTLFPSATGFVRDLDDDTTGLDHMLFLNGGGRLILQGESTVRGGVVVEDGIVKFDEAINAPPEVLLWSDMSFAVSRNVDRLDLRQRVVTEECPEGEVVSRTAFVPLLAASDHQSAPPFEIGPVAPGETLRTIRFRIENATRGFTYFCSSAGEPTGPFVPCAAAVTAAADGELELAVEVPADEPRRFFRLSVDFR